MDLTGEEEKRDEFKKILYDLANPENPMNDKQYRSRIYKRLESLYWNTDGSKQFRHFYSDIFSVLSQVAQEPSKGNIDILGQNMALIRKGYNPQNVDANGENIDITDAINKLYDHISLDIARISYSAAGDRKVSGEEAIADLQSQIEAVKGNLNGEAESVKKLQSQIETVKSDLNGAIESVRNQQKEYVSILGIFAAAVLAFTGGIVFSTSVLENIAESSIYRTVLIALIIGLVLSSVLYGLFYYIGVIVGSKISVKPFAILESIIIMLIIATIIAWAFGFVEHRNARIESMETQLKRGDLNERRV